MEPDGAVDQRVRIARVIARLNVGGPAIHVTALSSRLSSRGFDTRLYCGEVSPGESEMSAALRREDVEPWRIRGLGRAIRAADDLRALEQLVRAFRSYRPHIVHTHTAKAGALGRVAAWLCQVPVVVHTFHGHVFEGYFSPGVSKTVAMVERGLMLVTDRIVAISPRQRDDISRHLRIGVPTRVSLIPLGFDLSRFDHVMTLRGRLRAELGLRDEPILSIIGRLTPVKDHPLLFSAFRQLSDTSAHLCIVGGGESEAELRALALRLGIEARTHFLGFRDDLEVLLADTDVVALTSRNEGTPVALVEALAAGCTPVALAVGGVPDVLEDGKWGLLVGDRTVGALAEALRRALILTRTVSAETVRARMQYARSRYGMAALLAAHEAMYRELLGQREWKVERRQRNDSR
jgi:glycosyltransferase involved in cell wall biosynthesis